MKTIILALCLISIMTWAKNPHDGYHATVIQKCDAGETCLVSMKDNSAIKMIDVIDYDDSVIGKKLNTTSMLSDVIHDKSQHCIQGDLAKICEVIESLAGNNELEYFTNGGHALIKNLECSRSEKKLNISFTVDYDMGGPEQVKKQVSSCL